MLDLHGVRQVQLNFSLIVTFYAQTLLKDGDQKVRIVFVKGVPEHDITRRKYAEVTCLHIALATPIVFGVMTRLSC